MGEKTPQKDGSSCSWIYLGQKSAQREMYKLKKKKLEFDAPVQLAVMLQFDIVGCDVRDDKTI